MNKLNFEHIAKKIRETRISKEYTQEYLAAKVGINTSHICNIENGRAKVSLSALVGICNALDVTVDYMLSDEYTTVSHSSLENEILKEIKKCDALTKEKILRIVQILQ